MDEILELLQENSRLTPKQIATMLDMDESEVADKISEIEKERVIVKYGATVNWDNSSCDVVSALIEVKVQPQRGVGFNEVARRIYNFPEVRSMYLMSGNFDFLLEIKCSNLREIADFVSYKLSTIEFVQSTATNFVLQTYKQDGVVFEPEEIKERLKVTP